MATAHIANALMKIVREWAVSLKLKQFANPGEFLSALEVSWTKEPYVAGLYKELLKRRDKPDWKDS